MPVPDAEKYDGVFFIIFEDTNNPIQIESAVWCTDKKPAHSNKIAIVSCTFKREEYILKIIADFEDFIAENARLEKKIKLFVVDNGKTLDTSTRYKNTKIIPNMNAGGAGGFTRGLMEAVDSQENFTRILFMDDDVEIIPESFFRTLSIADYLRDEYKNAFINGAMMDLYAREILFENLGVPKKFDVVGYISDLNVYEYNNILKAIDIPDNLFTDPDKKVHSAWWYNCFPVSMVKNDGLPCPLFIRGDDIEWSWRHQGTRHISMNGICVWHAPFMWKVSPVMEYYYSRRNYFLLNILYTKDFKENFVKYYKEIFYYLLKTYNYNAVELLFQALDDILKGSAAFKENPEEQFKKLNAIAKKVVYFPAENRELEFAKTYFPLMKKRKIIYKFTLHGKLFPSFLFKKEGIALEWFPPVENFMLCKEVKVYNLATGKYCVRKYDPKMASRYEKGFKKRIRKLKARYDDLRKGYLQAHKEFSSFDFWQKYLELK
jgi:GT2 family glycosyltransferase